MRRRDFIALVGGAAAELQRRCGDPVFVRKCLGEPRSEER